MNENIKETASAATGTATSVGALYIAGQTGLSAAGITSGLATLGVGSMLSGIFVTGVIGYGAYKGTKWIISEIVDGEKSNA